MTKDAVLSLAESDWGGPQLRQRLEQIAKLGPGGRVVCAPDVHLKPRCASPSGLAVAFERHIVPRLSSADFGLGSGVIRTGIPAARVTPDGVRSFFENFSNTFASRIWDLDADQIAEVAARGPGALAGRYSIPLPGRRRAEADSPASYSTAFAKALLAKAPTAVRQTFQQRVGLLDARSHFVELQAVGAVRDSATATALNLREGELVVTYRSGGGLLPSFIGGLFGADCATTNGAAKPGVVGKLRAHVVNGSASRFNMARLKYFSPKAFVRHDVSGAEGRRLADSLAVAENLGATARLATVSRILRVLEVTFGAAVDAGVVCDGSTQSIRQELVAGRQLWIHRRDTSRVEMDVPHLIYGTSISASFLVVGAESAYRFLNSAPADLAELVTRNAEPVGNGAGETMQFTDGKPASVAPHVATHPLRQAVERMEAEGLLRRVVELTPLAVLNGAR